MTCCGEAASAFCSPDDRLDAAARGPTPCTAPTARSRFSTTSPSTPIGPGVVPKYRARTRAIARSSITRGTATASRRNASWWATISIRKSDSCGATTCAGTSACSGSVRGRPQSKSIRKFSWTGSLAYIENGAGRVETRDWQGEFAIEFQNSDRFSVGYGDTFEFLARPFDISRGITVPVGGYHFAGLRVGFNLGPQRTAGGNFLAEYGSFYSGHKLAVSASRGRVKITTATLGRTHFFNQQGRSRRRLVHGPAGRVARDLHDDAADVRERAGAVHSASHALMANVRLRWEYRPGSELFVVFNEERDTLAPRFPRSRQPGHHRQDQSFVSVLKKDPGRGEAVRYCDTTRPVGLTPIDSSSNIT